MREAIPPVFQAPESGPSDAGAERKRWPRIDTVRNNGKPRETAGRKTRGLQRTKAPGQPGRRILCIRK